MKKSLWYVGDTVFALVVSLFLYFLSLIFSTRMQFKMFWEGAMLGHNYRPTCIKLRRLMHVGTIVVFLDSLFGNYILKQLKRLKVTICNFIYKKNYISNISSDRNTLRMLNYHLFYCKICGFFCI